MSMQKTLLLKKEEARENKKWFMFDASGKTLGRFAAEMAKILRGKHKADFTPHVDCGDGVVILNADKIVVTGNKEAQMVYRRHSTKPGNLKEIPYRTMMQKKPTFILEHAVKGMMPKTRLSRAQLKRLRIFAHEEHNMDAQQPIAVEV